MIARRLLPTLLVAALLTAFGTGNARAQEPAFTCPKGMTVEIVAACQRPNRTPIASRGRPQGSTDVDLSVAYDQDKRVEYYDSDAKQSRAQLAAAVAILKKDLIKPTAGGKHQLRGVKNLRATYGICCDGKFLEQPAAGHCSGVLVSKQPPIVLTASHCFRDGPEPSKVRFVLGFGILTEGQDMFAPFDAAICTAIPDRIVSRGAWSLVPLECPNGAPLPDPPMIDEPGAIRVTHEVFAAGFPQGLPVKLAPKGRIKKLEAANGENVSFIATLDVFFGSSGSGVYRESQSDGKTMLVGILDRGLHDYEEVKMNGFRCQRTCVVDTVRFPSDGESVIAITRGLLDELKGLNGP